MKKILLKIGGIILALVSVLLICYPFISNYLMSLNEQSAIMEFDEQIKNIDEDIIAQAREEAEEYNKSLYGTVIITDPFDPNYQAVVDYNYEKLLNLSDNGIMGSVEIPAINVNLPIYHGTSEEVLEKGSGHLQNTSLPIGGKSTHAVLTGHTGLSSARLFTDLNQLIIGDVFYIHVLNEILAYQVDDISVVMPSDTSKLNIDPEKDYVTLVTCTPYGVNSHRLLVRGTRIPYEEAEEIVENNNRNVESTWMREYKKALMGGAVLLVVVLIIFIVIRVILRRRRKQKETENKREI